MKEMEENIIKEEKKIWIKMNGKAFRITDGVKLLFLSSIFNFSILYIFSLYNPSWQQLGFIYTSFLLFTLAFSILFLVIGAMFQDIKKTNKKIEP